MKDFGHWFAGKATPAPAPEPTPEADLPEGITEHDGVYFATCCACGKDDPLIFDVKLVPETGYRHYCGGGPRCCP